MESAQSVLAFISAESVNSALALSCEIQRALRWSCLAAARRAAGLIVGRDVGGVQRIKHTCRGNTRHAAMVDRALTKHARAAANVRRDDGRLRGSSAGSER